MKQAAYKSNDLKRLTPSSERNDGHTRKTRVHSHHRPTRHAREATVTKLRWVGKRPSRPISVPVDPHKAGRN